jgi:hypothetical protein
MATIASNVSQALNRANADDSVIQTYAEGAVIRWVGDQYRSFRWDFARTETSESLSSGASSIALASDYARLNTVKLKDSSGNYTTVEVIEREKFDRITTPTATGTPLYCAVLGTMLYFYPVADKAYTVYYDYWANEGTLTNASTVQFPDRIIEQVAYIAALSYDRLDTTLEEAKLKDMVTQFRRNMHDGGRYGSQVPLDPNVYKIPGANFY